MNILLIGSGGREHALAWKIKQSPHCEALYIAPGNAGTATVGTNLSLDTTDFESVGRACLERKIDILVVGPEDPLVGGIIDYFSSDERFGHLILVGPSKDAAMLEGSKQFAKAFMSRHGIPTADHMAFTRDLLEEGLAYIREHRLPVVLKADGLAAGKGVLICREREEALDEFRAILDGKFGSAGNTVVVEEFLEGIELSVFVLADGTDYVLLPTSKDYKRAGEGDSGLNTGGMGAVSPVPFATDAFLARVEDEIIRPTLNGMKQDGMPYRGFLYFGLMKSGDDPYVIEYNIRMGDPETQAVMPMLENDLLQWFQAMHNGRLAGEKLQARQGYATAVVLASEGYPLAYEKGMVISGLDSLSSGLVFHAGTKRDEDKVITAGGRVLAVTSLGNTLREAIDRSYDSVKQIQFDNKYVRSDIGKDLLQ